MRRTFSCFAGALVALAALAPSVARANGRFPASNQLLVAPSDPQLLVLRTTFGTLVSHDGGGAWDWICEVGIIDGGFGGNEDPATQVTASGTIIEGLFEGLMVSQDTGCTWQPASASFASQDIVDDVVRPDAPHTVLALTNAFAGNDDAGEPTFASQVYVSTDDAKTWGALGAPIDPTYILETIEVAPSDPHRLYASGIKSGAKGAGALFVSTDDGAHWTARPIALDPIETAPFISAVDPTNPDRVYVRTSGSGANRLLVTDDAGMTFRTAFTSQGKLLGFALGNGGARVYVGGPMDGLHAADRDALSFAQMSTIDVQCLSVRDGTLYACSDEKSGFILGSSTDEGAHWNPQLHISYGIRGPLACGTTASICAAPWMKLKNDLSIADFDGGPGDGGSGGGGGDAGGAQPSSSGCGCVVDPAPAGASALAATLALLALAFVRRKR